MKRKVVVLLLASVFAAGVAVWAYLPRKTAKDSVYSGTVEAVEVLPSFQMPGRIISVNFAEGEAVSEGQLRAVRFSDEIFRI